MGQKVETKQGSWQRLVQIYGNFSRCLRNPCKMYGLIKTNKQGNPVRVITSECGTAIENLSIFVEKCLYSEVLKIESRVTCTSEMITVIDNLNKGKFWYYQYVS